MSTLEERLASRWFEERYARLLFSMSLQDAKRVLGLPADSNPTPEEVSKAYKRKAIENHPDRGGTHEKMVEVNVAKDILEGKQRPDGPSRGWRPQNPGPPRKTYEDYVREKQEADAKKIRKGDDFNTAKSKAPTGVTWKFRSALMLGKENEFTKGQGLNSYIAVWVCYGQSASRHVFMVVEHAVPNQFADVQFDSWSMEMVQDYPLDLDIEKLAPKAIKSISAAGKFFSGLSKPATRYMALDELTQAEFEKRSGGVALKDMLIGAGLTSGASSDRKVVVELDGKLNKAKAKQHGATTTLDAWKWYDFTLYVNGKGYPLSDASVENLGKHGTSGNLFWMAVYSPVQYDYGRRRVLTKIPRYGSKILEMVEEALSGEPSELTVSLLKAIEAMAGSSKSAAVRVAMRFREG